MPSSPNDGDLKETPSLVLNSELPFQGISKRKTRRKKNKKGVITANVAGTKYEIVRLAIEEMGFIKTRDEDDTANLIWNDSAVQHEKIAELRNYQRINHFPGMGEICRKDCLARNMSKMIKIQPQEYCFIPRTWIFPAEYTQFQNVMKELKKKRKQKTFIVKPANGAMGHGISLIRNGEKLQAQEHLIVQEYLDKPFLIEEYKFDLRVYILITSCDPLRVFLYNDGLVRMGTEKYHPPNDSNMNQLYMHLTNYSVNKHNENFERDDNADKGSKRSIKWFTEFLRNGDFDVVKFWNDISCLYSAWKYSAKPWWYSDSYVASQQEVLLFDSWLECLLCGVCMSSPQSSGLRKTCVNGRAFAEGWASGWQLGTIKIDCQSLADWSSTVATDNREKPKRQTNSAWKYSFLVAAFLNRKCSH